MATKTGISQAAKEELNRLFASLDLTDYKWIDPARIVVSQWVRMKCMFGCPGYGRFACCPPNTPSVAECERFFSEYTEAVIFHFTARVDDPNNRHAWNAKNNRKLMDMERTAFTMGHERAFLLIQSPCGLCKECVPKRVDCQNPRLARPSPESMAVDVYSTVRQFGFPIQVLSDYDQEMNRYGFLMVA